MKQLTAKQAREISDYNKTFEAVLEKILDAIKDTAGKGGYCVDISL